MAFSIGRLEPAVMRYAWGSRTAIAGLRGDHVPAATPEAEWWMGAHSKAPSSCWQNDLWQPLDALIETDPVAFLGQDAARTFGSRLSYLLKVLAVDAPLSLQVHPDREQALAGFEAENREKIPLDHPSRNFRDPNPKPECVCALTPFWVLQGFRPLKDAMALLQKACPKSLEKLATVGEPAGDEAQGLRAVYGYLMELDPEAARAVVAEALDRAQAPDVRENPIFEWVETLARAYPLDTAALAPLFMNLTRLLPEEALFLEPGTLHAYLCGTAIEIMANSDNVLRGGLTPKHVDVAALLKMVRFSPRAPRILKPVTAEKGAFVYPTDTAWFSLSVLKPSLSAPYLRTRSHGLETVLCTHGSAFLVDEETGSAVSLRKGQAAVVPAEVLAYRLSGDGVFYRAGVPDDSGPGFRDSGGQ